jgi:hypothetical protein
MVSPFRPLRAPVARQLASTPTSRCNDVRLCKPSRSHGSSSDSPARCLPEGDVYESSGTKSGRSRRERECHAATFILVDILSAFRSTVTLFWLGAAAGTFGCGVRYWVCEELDDTQLETRRGRRRVGKPELVRGAPDDVVPPAEELTVWVGADIGLPLAEHEPSSLLENRALERRTRSKPIARSRRSRRGVPATRSACGCSIRRRPWSARAELGTPLLVGRTEASLPSGVDTHALGFLPDLELSGSLRPARLVELSLATKAALAGVRVSSGVTASRFQLSLSPSVQLGFRTWISPSPSERRWAVRSAVRPSQVGSRQERTDSLAIGILPVRSSKPRHGGSVSPIPLAGAAKIAFHCAGLRRHHDDSAPPAIDDSS